jgi:hypothetical protein
MDHQRAGRVMRQLLAHRAEQERSEAAVAARTDDQHVCVPGGVDEDRRRRARDRHRLDCDLRLTDDLFDDRLHEPLSRLLDLRKNRDEIEARRGPGFRHHRRRFPRMHSDDFVRTKASLIERPTQRVLRCVGTVDADDDLPHPGVLPRTTR